MAAPREGTGSPEGTGSREGTGSLPYSKVCDVEDFVGAELTSYMHQMHPLATRVFGPEWPRGSEQRKAWEISMSLRALNDLGAVRPDAEILGVGAGREPTTLWLTRAVRRVFATDLYLSPGAWGDTADVVMLTDPSALQPQPSFDWRPDRLVVQHMDARELRFEDESFDGIFSSSSIEHFGGLDDVARAASEMCRVLAPGGIASISTELRVNGPAIAFPGMYLFDEPTLRACIVEDRAWELVEPLVTSTTPATVAAPMDLPDFVAGRVAMTPGTRHLALHQEGAVWTSVHLALRKRGRMPGSLA
jgi:SAM-dependent methyltransferase